MKIEIKYTSGILNLPARVADLAATASESQLRVLLILAASPAYLCDIDPYLTTISQRASLTLDEVKMAIAYWAQNGVLAVDGLDTAILEAAAAENQSQNKEPVFTGSQILAFMEKHKDFAALCDDCQTVLGKSFTAHDYNNLLNLKSYFKFSDDYILLLLTHCVEVEKASWAYVRKTAKALYDEGICTYTALDSHFSARKNKRSLEYKIRKLLGIGEREFVKTERTYIEKWIGLKISIELLTKAYEITLEKTGKVSLAYMAKVLDNWLSSGIKTTEDVEKSLEEYKNKQKLSISTFDTDDFFEAALERSNKKMMERRNK